MGQHLRAGRRARVAVLLGLACGWLAVPAGAQVEADPEPGWTNETELSLALTGGNSAARTFGFSNTLHLVRESSRLQVRVNGLRSRSAVEPFLQVTPGVRFPIAGAPDDPPLMLVRPGSQPDAEQYAATGRYDTEISERLFWNAGGGWDRNREAGILSRYTAFAGLGNVWRDSEALRLSTTYAASYTSRDEETADPRKDAHFAGARVGLDYRSRLGATVVHDGLFTANANLTALSDYSVNARSAVSVSLSRRLALRVGLQLLYESDPAPEDVAVIARAAVLDPDGMPGSGDELFETLADGGATITLGSGRIRRNRLDTIFRTALVIGF